MIEVSRLSNRNRRLTGLLAAFALVLCVAQAATLQAWHDVDCHEPVCAVCAFADSTQLQAAPSGAVVPATQAFSLPVSGVSIDAHPASAGTFTRSRAPPLSATS